MSKIKNAGFVAIMMLIISTNVFAQTNNLKTYSESKTIEIEQTEEYEKSITDEITIDNIKYHLKDVQQQKNIITLSKDKEEQKQKIVTTNNKSEILNLFDSKIQMQEDGYFGELELQIDSLEIKINNSYREEYKVYLQETYTDIERNELNNIPKEIEKDGTTYYLVNPIWTISKIEKIGDSEVPVAYNGIMNYEGIKTREVIKDYKASVKYLGTLKKEIVETATYTLNYEEIPQESNYIMPVVTATAGIIIFSGIVLVKTKNIKIYNYDQGKYRLIKKININKKDSVIDITPLRPKSNKYKIVLSDRLYNKLKDTNVRIKYFDKQYLYSIKTTEFEINV